MVVMWRGRWKGAVSRGVVVGGGSIGDSSRW